jgi:hypothetical protein
MNPNPIRKNQNFTLVQHRRFGRGKGLNSIRAEHQVTWASGQILVNSVFVFNLTLQPVYLDFAYDQLDRPQVCWKTPAGEVLIYFYNGLLADYETKSLGFTADEPIICNDFLLYGSNTIFAYLKSKVPYYRLQSDRYTIEYQWDNKQYQAIKALGVCAENNSVQLLLG